MLKLLLLGEFIPSEVIVNIYNAFILPHLEYCAPVLVVLSPGLSNKLELSNQFAFGTLMNIAKSYSYGDLLTLVNLKSLEHRRYSQALILFTNACTMWGLITLRKCFYSVKMIMTLEVFGSLISPRIILDTCTGHIITVMTSRLWNNLPDCVRKAPSLNSFKSMLHQINLTTGVK